MEPQSPESSEQKEGSRTKETVVPPEIIRPLARALRQRFSPHIRVIKKSVKALETSGAFSQEYGNLVGQALTELNDRLLSLQQSKEVKLVEDIPEDPEDFPTIGIECSPETERDVSIPPSTTIIEEPFLPNLGIGLQDYLMSAVNTVRRPSSSFPDSYKEHLSQVTRRSQLIVTLLRTVTNASRISITNTEKRSTFNLQPQQTTQVKS